jgi:hypothetical protein
MSIYCGCSDDEGTRQTGIRLVTCRKPRKCGDGCGKDIQPGDSMYHVSFYDYDECKPASPMFVCEECGDMAQNIADLGLCYSWGNVREQWLEYLDEQKAQVAA